VTLSQATDQPVTVHYATADGTAVRGQDYAATSGTLAFAPGQTHQTIAVPILPDPSPDPTETFSVNLTSPGNATIADGQGIGTIVGQGAPPPVVPTISIGNAEATEVTTGTTSARFTVSLSQAATAPVTVAYATQDSSATAGHDYTATSGTLTFAPGITSMAITVPILNDLAVDGDETFYVNLSGAANAALGVSRATGTIHDAVPPPANNAVTFKVADDWGAGFVANMTIQNNQATPVGGWTLEFDFAADITNIWNATIVSHVGKHYVIRAAPWNSTIAARSAVSFGFQGAPGHLTGGPTDLVLNGIPPGNG